MAEELINFDLPRNKSSIIKVLGIGGGGSNAVNHMFRQGIRDVDFVVCNTDAQALINSPVPTKIQLGTSLTEGLGAGKNRPDVGKEAAIESLNDIAELFQTNTKMVFITAGMGGGTGTGAAPVIAKAAKELGILTVAIATIPFRFEGPSRMNQAIDGLNELKNHVDSLLVINNEKLREIYGNLKFSEAFAKADNVLTIAAKGIAEIITVHGHMNVDFADVKTVMTNSGVAVMGSSTGEGPDRAITAIQNALNSPLLNNNDIKGAKNILLNITSGNDEITMDEIYDITEYIGTIVSKEVNIIWGTCADPTLGDKISVTIIATGFEANSIPELYARNKKVERSHLTENPINQANKGNTPLGIELKNKQSLKLKDESPLSQRAFEFDSNPANLFKDKTPSEFEIKKKTYSEVRTIESKPREVIQENNNELTIDDLENQPAYVRKNLNIDPIKPSETISRFTLSEDEDKNIKLRSDNQFLHDNVD